MTIAKGGLLLLFLNGYSLIFKRLIGRDFPALKQLQWYNRPLTMPRIEHLCELSTNRLNRRAFSTTTIAEDQP